MVTASCFALVHAGQKPRVADPNPLRHGARRPILPNGSTSGGSPRLAKRLKLRSTPETLRGAVSDRNSRAFLRQAIFVTSRGYGVEPKSGNSLPASRRAALPGNGIMGHPKHGNSCSDQLAAESKFRRIRFQIKLFLKVLDIEYSHIMPNKH